MFESIKNLLKLNKETETKIEYKSSADLGKETYYDIIPTIEIPTNEKPNILILDDNVEAGKVTVLDLEIINSIALKIRENGLNNLSKKQKEFIEKLPNRHLDTLMKFDLDNYNVILSTGIQSAFSVFEAIDNGLKVDYAILDILIGGHNKYKDKTRILDGIDVAKKILESNPRVKYKFYSGCSLVDDSDESIKFKNTIGGNLTKKVIIKDKNLNWKREKILELFE